MRKALLLTALSAVFLGAGAGNASATTFEGDCKFKGTVFMEDPYTLIPENKDYQAHADGTCTGKVDGAAYDGPAHLYIDGRMDRLMSCPHGFDDKAPGTITFGTNPDAVDAKQIDVSIMEGHHATPAIWFIAHGAYNGQIAGAGQFLGFGPEQLEQCSKGLEEIDFELQGKTITPLYG